MSTEPQDQAKTECCGNGPTGGASEGGKPQTQACQLCPESGKYWDPTGEKKAALAEL